LERQFGQKYGFSSMIITSYPLSPVCAEFISER